jgi:hypothetical protein
MGSVRLPVSDFNYDSFILEISFSYYNNKQTLIYIFLQYLQEHNLAISKIAMRQ